MQDFCDLSCGRCEDVATKVVCPGTKPNSSETPTVPYARHMDLPWMTVGEWCNRFRGNLQDPARAKAQLVFIGDSITEGWAGRGAEVWKETFGPYQALHLGIGGDQTQQVLWRIQNGELNGLQPKLIVLLIGVNNIGWGNWNEVESAAGVEAVLKTLHERLPQTEIIHLAIFPAMEKPDDAFRLKIRRTNEYLAKIKIDRVRFLDLGRIFLNSDASISPYVMYDYLHPDQEGYRRWAQALLPELKKTFGY